MARKDKIILKELLTWLEDGLISEELHQSLSAKYRVTSWDLTIIIRWTLIFGAVMLGIGLITFISVIIESLVFVAFILSLLVGLGYYFGFQLTNLQYPHYYPKTGNALIAVACLLVCADIFVIGDLLSTGSGHWSLLLFFTMLLYFGIAYLKRNTLVLVFALLGLATWFGTESGYISGWGVYFLGLNYPMRFAVVSPFVVLIGYLHQYFRARVPESFIKTYYALGLLYINLSLWIMSIFGNYGNIDEWHNAKQVELLVFAILWGVADVIIFLIGAKFHNKMFSGYASVFLILNLYTRYFEYFWNEMDKALFFIVLGGISIGVGLYFEQRLKQKPHEQES